MERRIVGPIGQTCLYSTSLRDGGRESGAARRTLRTGYCDR